MQSNYYLAFFINKFYFFIIDLYKFIPKVLILPNHATLAPAKSQIYKEVNMIYLTKSYIIKEFEDRNQALDFIKQDLDHHKLNYKLIYKDVKKIWKC